jgi:hypothetical protein
LRDCDRRSEAVTVTTRPSRSRRRDRAHDGKERDPAMSKVTEARVFDVLTCWPPAPLDAENRH